MFFWVLLVLVLVLLVLLNIFNIIRDFMEFLLVLLRSMKGRMLFILLLRSFLGLEVVLVWFKCWSNILFLVFWVVVVEVLVG